MAQRKNNNIVIPLILVVVRRNNFFNDRSKHIFHDVKCEPDTGRPKSPPDQDDAVLWLEESWNTIRR